MTVYDLEIVSLIISRPDHPEYPMFPHAIASTDELVMVDGRVQTCGILHEEETEPRDCPVASRWTILAPNAR